MADRDPAFLWETEALRTPAVPPPDPRRPTPPGLVDRAARDGWLTLREASSATGIPVATLRSWALKEKVPSALDETRFGTRRMVSLDGVLARARQMGREVKEVASTERSESATDRAPTGPPQPSEVTPPPGTMIVPIDAWDKMLLQLGNLHEAGQQLAEARERAARAETEASFLRERLAELRPTKDVSGEKSDEAAVVSGETAANEPGSDTLQPSRMPSFTAYLWRLAASSRRRKS